MFDNNLQVFIDVYLTLDSYGMHLIKDVWDRFYILCQNANNNNANNTNNTSNTNNTNNNNNDNTDVHHTLTTIDYLHILLLKV